LILQDWGRLEGAMAPHKKQEELCLELGNKDSLPRSSEQRRGAILERVAFFGHHQDLDPSRCIISIRSSLFP
jgi:hypothetical protein